MSAGRRRGASALGQLRSAAARGYDGWLAFAQHVVVGKDEFAHFGARSRINPPCRVIGQRYISLGDDVLIASGGLIGVQDELNGTRYAPRLSIGSRSSFGNGLFISCCGEIEIGEDVLGSSRVFIADSYHDYHDASLPPIRQPFAEPRNVRIGDGAFLGVGSCVLAGVTLGARAYVAANAVVTHDVAELTLVAGAPARPIKRWDGQNWVAV